MPPTAVDHLLALAWLAFAGASACGRLPRDTTPAQTALAATLPLSVWLGRLLFPSAGPLTSWLVLPLSLALGAGCWVFASPDLLKHIPGIDWSRSLGNTALMPRCRTPNMHQAFCRTADAGGYELLFLGDSLTARWLGDGRAAWQRFADHAANFGVGGDRIQHLLWRVRHGELAGAPSGIVLLIGTNNVDANTPPEIAAGVAAILAEIKTRLPTARTLLIGLLPRCNYSRAIAATNAALERLTDGDRVCWFDAGPTLAPNGDPDSMLFPDGLHLSPAGYERFAAVLSPAVLSLRNHASCR